MIVQIDHGEKSFGGQIVFSDCQFLIKGNEKIALVGRNGSGKTTLFKILAGEELLDKGNIIKGSTVKLGYVRQMAFSDENLPVKIAFESVFDEVNGYKQLIDQANQLLQLNPSDEKALKQLSFAQNQFEEKGGYSLEQQMKSLLTAFGFESEDLNRSLSTFSGGQRTRLAFIQMLLQQPDVLLLDEPTNHMDIATIEWLEGYLSRYPKAVVVTSHDRLFLDRVCSVVVEIEHGKTTRFKGNYSSYIEQKKQMIEKNNQLYFYQQKEIQRLEALIEKFRYKKNKAAFAKSKEKYLDRMDRIEYISEDESSIKAAFKPKVKGGKEVLVVDHLKVGYDHPLATVSFKIHKGDRLAIIGENGCGKSTLLKTIVNEQKGLGGEYLLGHQIQIGYFRQDLHQFDNTKTVLDEVWDRFPKLDKTQIRTALARFLFKGESVFKEISVLSGGEKVRLALLILLLEGANLLIMDEPTNHLDMESKQALEQALLSYEGTLIFVSHDRYFIEQVSTCKLIFTKEEVKFVEPSVTSLETDYLTEESSKKEKTQNDSFKISTEKRKLKKQIEKLEEEILKNQEILESLRELRFEPEYYHDTKKMDALNMDIDECVNEIANLEQTWMELSEQFEKLETI